MVPALGRQREAGGSTEFEDSLVYLCYIVRLLSQTTKSQNQNRICDGVEKPDLPHFSGK